MPEILPGQHWFAVKDGDPRAVAIYERHYSCAHPKNRRIDHIRYGFSGKGESMVLLTQACDALFCWRVVVGEGVQCSVFRNEGEVLSSLLIQEADELAWQRWPGQRLYTYVNPAKVHGDGACFKHAGWCKCGRTKGRLIILELLSHA